MSSLTGVERVKLERMLRMSDGYVLGFNDRTFGEFFLEVAGVEIHSEKYRKFGTSKANKLRAFWDIEDDALVGKALRALTDRAEAEFGPLERELLDACSATVGRLLAGTPSLADLKAGATAIDAAYLAAQIQRMEGAIHTDPALAIGTAKELVETVCKTVLHERKIVVDPKAEVPALTKAALRELRLVPEAVTEPGRVGEVTKQLLSNLSALSAGVAELRNLIGTGHGKHGRAPAPDPVQAALAVGAAAAFARFVLQVHRGPP